MNGVDIQAGTEDALFAFSGDPESLIVEDAEIQGGAATFRGTRLLVHHIADLLGQGVSTTELQEDYPRLTPEMLVAAPIYARAYPQRGRPRQPVWRIDATKPLQTSGR